MAAMSTCLFSAPSQSRHFVPYSSMSLKPSSHRLITPPLFQFSTTISISIRNPSCSSRPRKPSFIRARVDAPYAFRPGSVVESDKLPSDVRKRAMDAVDWFGGRVTVGDVAAKAGLKLNEAQKALQALAADTNGFLEVSNEGDVLFVFPKDYRAKLAAKSLRLKVEPWVEKAKSAAEYLIRVSFGTTLIASIVIVFTAIVVALSSGKTDEDNRGRRSGRAFDSGITFWFRPSDIFWIWDPVNGRRTRNEGMDFIESVFSFVFGDGDPNQGIEDERWKLIGQYIAANGGVVTAEELAPYLDVETAEDGDESFILPVLLRFDGEPEVDEEGNILYRFPSLQRTASPQRRGKKEYVSTMWSEWIGRAETFKEIKWILSKTSAAEKAMVIGLGGINLLGVIILGTLLRDITVSPSGFLRFVANIFPLLQVYAGSFFAIPLIRWLFILKANNEIDKRNGAREKFAQVLQRPDPLLRRKLLSARDMSRKTVIGQDQIIYSSDRDLIEQDYDSQEWKRKFGEIE